MKEPNCSNSSKDNISCSSGNVDEASNKSAEAENRSQSQSLPHLRCPDEKLGFIMFECGLEGISLKGVKNSESIPKIEDKDETVSVTICNELNNIHRGSSQNLASTVETLASDKEATIVGTAINSKEDVTIPECNVSTPGKHSAGGDTEIFDLTSEKDKENSMKLDVKKSGAASVSCVIQFKVMWYNFAAPPQTPITRKIDYTR